MDLSLPRRVEPELLDGLAADDPRARRSRADLRRIHRAMATLPIVQRAMDRGTAKIRPRTLARARGRRRLPDAALGEAAGSTVAGGSRHVAGPARSGRARRRWTACAKSAGCPASRRWMCSTGWHGPTTRSGMSSSPTCSSTTFRRASSCGCWRESRRARRVFLCCEPRRSALPLAGSHLIGLLGAGPVTRQDAVSSVHAGFRARELSDLWPSPQDWVLDEYPAGLFSHCFLAVRKAR